MDNKPWNSSAGSYLSRAISRSVACCLCTVTVHTEAAKARQQASEQQCWIVPVKSYQQVSCMLSVHVQLSQYPKSYSDYIPKLLSPDPCIPVSDSDTRHVIQLNTEVLSMDNKAQSSSAGSYLSRAISRSVVCCLCTVLSKCHSKHRGC